MERALQLNSNADFLLTLLLSNKKPKQKRLTTAKAHLNTAISVAELMSPSEDENEDEDDDWRPEKPEAKSRPLRKVKPSGVRKQNTFFLFS